MNQMPAVAIDIDDTLADTARYFAEILNERFGNPEGLSAEEIMEKYFIIPNVPYWQTPEILSWREQESLSNERQLTIPPIADALDVVKKLHSRYQLIYISSRPTRVEKGTEKWLLAQGFPQGELILRNEQFQVLNGNAWKAKVLTEPKYNVVAIIEDNPEIIGYLRRLYKGVVYLIGTATNTDFSDVSVRLCKNWKDVENGLYADQLLT